VLDQTFSDFELLVMDDGSSDNTKEIVSEFNDARIIYDWAPNSGGPATPRNRGIDLAVAEWICFLDADDIWYYNKLEYTYRWLLNYPDVILSCHNEELFIVKTGVRRELKHGPYVNNLYEIMLREGNRLSTSAVIVKRDFLNKYHMRFNESPDYIIVEDYDLWLRLILCGAVVSFMPEILGKYIIEDDNLTGNQKRFRRNLTTMLYDHVYYHQKFSLDKDKLWQQIECRLIVFDAKAVLLSGGNILNVFILLLKAFTRSPLVFIKILYSTLINKIF